MASSTRIKYTYLTIPVLAHVLSTTPVAGFQISETAEHATVVDTTVIPPCFSFGAHDGQQSWDRPYVHVPRNAGNDRDWFLSRSYYLLCFRLCFCLNIGFLVAFGELSEASDRKAIKGNKRRKRKPEATSGRDERKAAGRHPSHNWEHHRHKTATWRLGSGLCGENRWRGLDTNISHFWQHLDRHRPFLPLQHKDVWTTPTARMLTNQPLTVSRKTPNHSHRRLCLAPPTSS